MEWIQIRYEEVVPEYLCKDISDFAIYDNLRYKFTFPLSTYQNKIQHIIYVGNETPIFSWAFSPNSLGSRYDHVAQTWAVRCVKYSIILPESLPFFKFYLFAFFSCAGSSLLYRPSSCGAERGCSLVAVRGLLVTVASLTVGLGSGIQRLQWPQRAGSALEQRLSSSGA